MNRNRFAESMLKGIFDETGVSPIKDSKFALNILNLYRKDPELDLKIILGIDLKDLDEEDFNILKKQYENLPNTDKLQDFRIKNAMMHGIRGVEKIKDDVFFGMDCTDSKDTPCSMVVVGSNGIGKTSFYSALEITGMGHSNCAELRGYITPEENVKFLTNVNSSSADGRILTKTGNDTWVDLKLDQYDPAKIDTIGNECCFCSDFDIQQLETYTYSATEKTFSKYIHSQLNLGGFDTVIPLLDKYEKRLSEYAKEIKELTVDILDLKSKLFLQTVLKYLIYNQSVVVSYDMSDTMIRILKIGKGSPLILKIMDHISGKIADEVAGIEQKVIDRKYDELSQEEYRCLLNAYREELDAMYTFTDMNIGECHDSFAEICESYLNGEHYIQTKENIDRTLISYHHHACIHLLDRIVNHNASASSLSDKIDEFRELQKLREKIKTGFKEIINLFTADKLNAKQKEVDGTISRIKDKITEYRESLDDSIPLDIKNADEILDQSSDLKTYLKAEVAGYDKRIQGMLKSIIPAICSICFPKKGSERVEVRCTGIPDDNESPSSQYNENPFEIFIKVRPKGNDKNGANDPEKEPGLYLNTFRHKLFCFAMKLSLACCAMKLDNCMYPIIVDDVFDASDFKNRNQINRIIQKLIEQYKTFSEGKDNLQIILFTQDEIIAEKVFKGLTNGSNKARLERLVHPANYMREEGKQIDIKLGAVNQTALFHSVFDSIKNNF